MDQGHSGIEHNDKAGRLARLVALKENISQWEFIGKDFLEGMKFGKSGRIDGSRWMRLNLSSIL